MTADIPEVGFVRGWITTAIVEPGKPVLWTIHSIYPWFIEYRPVMMKGY